MERWEPIAVTDAQIKLVIAALVAAGLALAYALLSWTSDFQHNDWTPVFIFLEDLDPFGHVERWGLYTTHGEFGVIFGGIVPLCLFTAAVGLGLWLRVKDGRR
jgi:hypothetical protein